MFLDDEVNAFAYCNNDTACDCWVRVVIGVYHIHWNGYILSFYILY